MPRVMPSQIVGLIDQVISGMTVGPPPALNVTQAPEISAIIDLASELPNELVVLSGDEYHIACTYARDCDVGHVKRLCDHKSVHIVGTQFGKSRRLDIDGI